MANFLLLYTGGEMPEGEAAAAAVMQAWGVWYGKLGSAVVDGGNPVMPKASIASNGTVGNGMISPMVTGYTIIKADSADAAIEISKGCPILAGKGQITVHEVFPAM